jgi:hypothetical protein
MEDLSPVPAQAAAAAAADAPPGETPSAAPGGAAAGEAGEGRTGPQHFPAIDSDAVRPSNPGAIPMPG